MISSVTFTTLGLTMAYSTTERDLSPEQERKLKAAASEVLNGRARRVEVHRRGGSLTIRTIIEERRETI